MPLVDLQPQTDEPAPTNTELDREALFVAVGLGPILEGKPSFHKYQIDRASKMPQEMRKRVLSFVASDTFKPAVDVPDFDYDETLKQVSAGSLNPDQSRALFAAVPDREMATEMAAEVTRILTWANPLLPRDSRPAVIGDRPMEPDSHSVSEFRRLWQVALDPMIILDDLEDGSLSQDQIDTLGTVYPVIYAELRQAITDEMAAMEARKGKNWEPDPRKAELLKMLMGTPSLDVELAATVQTVYAQEAQAKESPGNRKDRTKGATAEDAVTPGQKAAGGVSTAA